MANEQNLRPSEYKLSQEEAKKGGINSGKARRQKKLLRECLEVLLEKEMKGRNGEVMTGAEALSSKLFAEAMKGNVKAFEVLRDTAGQKPIDHVKMQTNVNIADSAERLSNIFKEIKKEK